MRLIESAVRKIVNKTMLTEQPFGTHLKDDLLRGITFEELVETLQSNESVHNERVVNKVFEELLKSNIADARHELKSNMQMILKNASYGHNE